MIPLDPADYDRLPPDDLHACPYCGGEGAVYEYHPEHAHHVDTTCPRCDGTGTTP